MALFGRTRTLRSGGAQLGHESVQLKIEARSRRRCKNAERTVLAQLERLGQLLDDPDALPSERAMIAAAAERWVGTEVDLHAVTRGWILDQVVDRVRQLRPSIDSTTMSVGPDALHVGSGSATVAVGSLDALASLPRVPLSDQAAVTATRDAPTSVRASATVIAQTAVTAAAQAHLLLRSGTSAADAPTWTPDSAWMIVDAEGQTHHSPNWPDLIA